MENDANDVKGDDSGAGGNVSVLSILKDLATLLSAIAGFFVVVLYLAGRAYMSSYFDALNIPPAHISFTIWEYSEAAWFPIFSYSLVMTIVGGFLAALVNVVVYPLALKLGALLAQVKSWLTKRLKLPVFEPPKISNYVKDMFSIILVAVWGLSVIYSLKFSLDYVGYQARTAAHNYVLKSSNRVEIISTSPQDLGDSATIISADKENTLYIYRDLRLLTYNNGKYYLFKDIDQKTCKPLQVYVVGAEQYIQVNILSAESLASRCNLDSSAGNSPTITPSPTSQAYP